MQKDPGAGGPQSAGRSYKEIAEINGTTVGAVESVLVRAHRALRELVEEEAKREGQWPLPAP